MPIVETVFDLLKEMRDAWAFQLHSGKKKNSYPNYIKPSQTYILLFGELPTSFTRRGILKELDKVWADNKDSVYCFTFNFHGLTTRINVRDCVDFSDAQDAAMNKLLKENLGLKTKDDIFSLINKHEMTVNHYVLKGDN